MMFACILLKGAAFYDWVYGSKYVLNKHRRSSEDRYEMVECLFYAFERSPYTRIGPHAGWLYN